MSFCTLNVAIFSKWSGDIKGTPTVYFFSRNVASLQFDDLIFDCDVILSFEERLANMENKVRGLEDKVDDLEEKVQTLEEANEKLEAGNGLLMKNYEDIKETLRHFYSNNQKA